MQKCTHGGQYGRYGSILGPCMEDMEPNKVLHGGNFDDPICLNKRAAEYLEKYWHTQVHLAVGPVVQSSRDVWKPPSQSVFKMNFDAAVDIQRN